RTPWSGRSRRSSSGSRRWRRSQRAIRCCATASSAARDGTGGRGSRTGGSRGILVVMSDTSADAGVVQSRVQLERLVAEDELAGRTIAGFSAPSVGLRAVDLDGVTLERLDLRGCDGAEARAPRPGPPPA